MSWFYYNCDGIDDRGWGCVHRSYQNAMRLLGREVSMHELVEAFGEKRWIEPAMLRPHLPDGFKSELLLWMKTPDYAKKMTCTKEEDYDRIVPSQFEIQLHDALYALARAHVFVVDNGTFSYCLFYSNGWKVLDPHVDQSEKVLVKIADMQTWLTQQGLWMVMAISPEAKEVKKVVGKHISFGPSTSLPLSGSGSGSASASDSDSGSIECDSYVRGHHIDGGRLNTGDE